MRTTCCKASAIVLDNPARIPANNSSNLGTVCFARGATRDFDATNLTRTSLSVKLLTYTTAAYADLLASPSPCNSVAITRPAILFKQHLGILRC